MELAPIINKQTVFIWICFFTFASSQVRSVEFEGRVGGFLSQSRLFREIYGTLIPSYQLEISGKPFWSFKIWGNIAYLNKEGYSVPFRTTAHLQMLPISAGLAYVAFLPKSFEFSVGAGARYTWLKETNTSGFIPSSNTIYGWGGIAKISLTKKIHWLVISAFADYPLQALDATNSTGTTHVNLSGLSFGGGIGGFY